MGIIAKRRTKARTAPVQHATALSADWGTEGMPQMASIVRATACSIGGRPNLRSSSFRGHDTLGLGSARRSGPSTTRFEQAGYDEWVLGLGLETVSGPTFDWALRLQTVRAEQVSVNITTPAVLTRDGAQVHGDEYLEARELIATGLTTGAAPAADLETAASRQGLAFTPLPVAARPNPPSAPHGAADPVERRLAAVEECGSLLAPIMSAIRWPPRGSSLANVISRVCTQVPATTSVRTVVVGRGAVPTPHTRHVVYWHDNDSTGYKIVVRCIDRAPEETPSEAFERWVWEIGVFVLSPQENPALAGHDHECFRADVTRFKLQNQGVLAAHQLAMFRALMVEGFRAIDRGAISVGGQTTWNPDWWPGAAGRSA